jgi:hypothetical protein
MDGRITPEGNDYGFGIGDCMQMVVQALMLQRIQEFEVHYSPRFSSWRADSRSVYHCLEFSLFKSLKAFLCL